MVLVTHRSWPSGPHWCPNSRPCFSALVHLQTLRTTGGMGSFTRPCLMTAPVPACRATTITFSRATCAASAEPEIQSDQNGNISCLGWRHFDSIRAVPWALTTDKNPHLLTSLRISSSITACAHMNEPCAPHVHDSHTTDPTVHMKRGCTRVDAVPPGLQAPAWRRKRATLQLPPRIRAQMWPGWP